MTPRSISTVAEQSECIDRAESVTVHTRGGSRVTASVETPDRRVIFRTPQESPYRQGVPLKTEYENLQLVSECGVTVPAPLDFVESSPGQRPFYLMEFLDGTAPEPTDPDDEWQPTTPRGDLPLVEDLLDQLETLHGIEQSEVQSEEPFDYATLVTKRIETTETIYRETVEQPEPVVEETLRWLRSHVPADGDISLVHGDFTLANTIVEGGELAGIIDWEFCRLGDPLCDLAQATNPLTAGDVLTTVPRPDLACCLAEPESFFERYEAKTSRRVDPDRLRFWRVYCILVGLVGIYRLARYFESSTDPDLRWGFAQYSTGRYHEELLQYLRTG